MKRLREPEATQPRMFGGVVASDPLPWDWAAQRLTRARNYWIATTRPDGRPHSRPVWGVWLDEGYCFSTGSLAAKNLRTNAEITVHLEDGDEVLIVEGVAERLADSEGLRRFVDAYNLKYGYDASVAGDEVADSQGNSGPAFLIRPRVVFGWRPGLQNATRWSFAGAT